MVAHKLEALGIACAFPIVLVSLLGIGARELLPAPLALVHRRVVRMRALVMAVAIVQAGKCAAALIALETNGWRRRVLDGRPRGHRKRRRVRVMENTRGDERGRGNVLNLRGLTVVAFLGRLLVLLDGVRHVGLHGWWLWVTRYPRIRIIVSRVRTLRVHMVPRLTKAKRSAKRNRVDHNAAEPHPECPRRRWTDNAPVGTGGRSGGVADTGLVGD